MLRQRRRWVWYAIVAAVGLWSVLQIAELAGQSGQREPAEKMLYQVALFQMELLGSHLTESAKAVDTDQLNSLRQAVYSASYTHQHLVRAFGEADVAPLGSVDKLLQYVLRLQVGGKRPLKAEEQQLLYDAGQTFGELFEAYGKLLSSRNDIVGSESKRLKEADAALAELLKERGTQ